MAARCGCPTTFEHHGLIGNLYGHGRCFVFSLSAIVDRYSRHRRTFMRKLLPTLAALLFCTTAFAAPGYQLVKTIPIGAPDRWDYVVYDDGRAYVAHGDALTVV